MKILCSPSLRLPWSWLFEMESLTDTPSKKFFPDGSSESQQRKNILLLETRQLVEKYMYMYADLLVPS